MYEVSYQISEDDYIAAQRLFRRKSSKLQGLGKLVVMLIGLLAAIVGIMVADLGRPRLRRHALVVV